uniref:Uncharacterized protein n=1 Tax=Arundo donax TaxID=35708 RepID=A0A0A9BBH1_ARUDO
MTTGCRCCSCRTPAATSAAHRRHPGGSAAASGRGGCVRC